MSEELFNEPRFPAFPRKRVGPRIPDTPAFRPDYEPSKLVTVSAGKMVTQLTYTQEQLDEINGVVKAPAGAPVKNVCWSFSVAREEAWDKRYKFMDPEFPMVVESRIEGQAPLYHICVNGWEMGERHGSVTQCIRSFQETRGRMAVQSQVKRKGEILTLIACSMFIGGKFYFTLCEGVFVVHFVEWDCWTIRVEKDGSQWKNLNLLGGSDTQMPSLTLDSPGVRRVVCAKGKLYDDVIQKPSPQNVPWTTPNSAAGAANL